MSTGWMKLDGTRPPSVYLLLVSVVVADVAGIVKVVGMMGAVVVMGLVVVFVISDGSDGDGVLGMAGITEGE